MSGFKVAGNHSEIHGLRILNSSLLKTPILSKLLKRIMKNREMIPIILVIYTYRQQVWVLWYGKLLYWIGISELFQQWYVLSRLFHKNKNIVVILTKLRVKSTIYFVNAQCIFWVVKNDKNVFLRKKITNYHRNSIFLIAGSGTSNNQTSTRVRLFSMEVEASKIGQVL